MTTTTIPAVISPHELTKLVSAKELCGRSTSRARSIVAFKDADRLQVLPIDLHSERDSEILRVFTGDAPTIELEQELRFLTDRRIEFVLTKPEVLKKAIPLAYHGDHTSFTKKLLSVVSRRPIRPDPTDLLAIPEGADTLKTILDYALALEASDVHILPRRDGSEVMLRVSGEQLRQAHPPFPHSVHEQIINRTKVLCRLDQTVRTRPQDGSFVLPPNVCVRASFLPTVHGESLALRLLPNVSVPTLDEVGLDPFTADALDRFLNSSSGAALFTGPTGSGKTTSMYASLQSLHHRGLHVLSVEDPVEIRLDGITQTSLDQRHGLDYPTALKAVLRQSPHAIMIGEIRDAASADIALQAALTGHLLLTTVHARSSIEVFLRLRSLGIDQELMSQSVRVVINQRLAPKLCLACRVIDLAGSRAYGTTTYKPVGCVECGYSGFAGRILLSECMVMSRALIAAISSGKYTTLLEHLDNTTYWGISRSIEGALLGGAISIQQSYSLLDQIELLI